MLTWAGYETIVAEAFTIDGEACDEAFERPSQLLLSELAAIVGADQAHQLVDLQSFVELHLRCGEELSLDDFEHFGTLLIVNRAMTREEEEAHAHFLESRRVAGDDEASADEGWMGVDE